MRLITTNKDADKQYTEAHAEHYVAKDLHKAFGLYRNIIATILRVRRLNSPGDKWKTS